MRISYEEAKRIMNAMAFVLVILGEREVEKVTETVRDLFIDFCECEGIEEVESDDKQSLLDLLSWNFMLWDNDTVIEFEEVSWLPFFYLLI